MLISRHLIDNVADTQSLIGEIRGEGGGRQVEMATKGKIIKAGMKVTNCTRKQAEVYLDKLIQRGVIKEEDGEIEWGDA